jgi:pimeloyl-ACP methyl ester carboxylesterase
MQPFTIAVADEVLSDLDRRLAATRWPDDFANDDWSYGVNVAYLKDLVGYWRATYDWRARERLMNQLPQFVTDVDGLRIHFVHVRGKGPNPVPLILSHGWPWTFWDYRRVIGPLTDPAAHGGDPADSFDVVVPSLPGYGFSTPLTTPGINWWKTADLWVKLMDQLGYGRFAAQGGDWGSFISAQLGHKYPERMIGVHIHTPSFLDFLTTGKFDKADFTEEEKPNLYRMAAFAAEETGYMALQKTKPQTVAIALNDSPAGLLGWLIEKRRRWSDCGGDVERRFSKDELIDLAMLYWATGSYHTSARFYREGYKDPWTPSHEGFPVVRAPTALAIMPEELTHPPRKWAERYYNLQRWTPMAAGGHFAAAEEPDALVADLREFFRDKR